MSAGREAPAARSVGRRLVLAALPLAGLAIFAALAAFAVPQADDFCYAAVVRSDGLIGGALAFYHDWTGRIAATLLIMLPWAAADATGVDVVQVYRAAGLALLALAAVPAALAARRLWPKAGPAATTAIAATLLYCLIANARSPRDLFYWLPGAVTYAVPGLLVAVLLVVLLTAAAEDRRVSLPAAVGLCLLALTAAAGNEFTGAMIATVAVASLWARRGGGPLQPVLHAGLLVAAAAGLLVQVLAPGTATRTAAATVAAGTGDLPGALLWGPVYFTNYLVLRVDAPGVLGWLLLAGLITVWHDRRHGRPHPPRPDLVWLPLAVFVAAGVAAFAAGYYGIGSMLPARAQNQVHLVGLFALTLATAAFVRSRHPALRAWRSRLPWATPRRLAVVAVVLILLSPQSIRAVYELIAEAPAYAAAQEGRFARLAAAGNGPVAVAPLPARPRHLHMEDLRPDPAHWVNRCVADYYGIETVVVAPD